MSLTTHSKFYFNYEITQDNNAIDFKEGAGPELQATIAVGSYSLTDFLDAIAAALNDAGALTYTVAVNRVTRIITISTTSTFSLLVSSGSRIGTGAWSAMGFSGADRTAASTYAGNLAAGSEYVTQFILQSHVATDDSIAAAEGTVNSSASGKVEVYRFGENRFMECNLMYATNRALPTGSRIRNDASGLSKLRIFMQFLITKGPVEFMPNEDDEATFETLMLESTPDDKNGISYKLKELYGKGLPGFYETGILKFRRVN
jgi:hypothetical protein